MTRPSEWTVRRTRQQHRVYLGVSVAAVILAYAIILTALIPASSISNRLTLLALAAISAFVSFRAAARAKRTWQGGLGKSEVAGVPPQSVLRDYIESAEGAWDAPQVGPGRAPFRGRSAELDDLLKLYQRAAIPRGSAQVRESPETERAFHNGPLVLLIYGMPGVGKSAVAGELAQRLRPDFDRVIYTGFSDRAGGSRSLSQILRSVGRAVGGKNTDPLVTLRSIRSTTAQTRHIFIFDEAEDAEFVKAVLPSGDQNLVIVTSRRNIGPSLGVRSYHSYFLDVLSEADAFAVWHTVSRTEEATSLQEATEVIEMCGRLPLALRAAADHLTDGRTPRDLVAALRPESTRLQQLSLYGWNVRRAIESEYDRLVPREQTALLRLSATKSESFVPWALTALLPHVSNREAEGILAQLNAAKLIDSVAQDQRFRLDRYQFHPLIRLFARERLIKVEGEVAVHDAQKRLAVLYLRAVDVVLAETESDYLGFSEQAQQYAGELPGPEMARWIASIPEQWIRAESGTLIDVVKHAYRTSKYEMCWRLAVRISATVGETSALADSFDCLSLAEEAFERREIQTDHYQTGKIEIACAKIVLNGLAGRVDVAEDLTKDAIRMANRMRSSHPTPYLGCQQQALVHLAAARSLTVNGMRHEAAAHARRARDLAIMAADDTLRIRAGLWLADQLGPEFEFSLPSAQEMLDDDVAYLYHTIVADRAEYSYEWATTRFHLQYLLDRYGSDCNLALQIYLRLAECSMNAWLFSEENSITILAQTSYFDAELGGERSTEFLSTEGREWIIACARYSSYALRIGRLVKNDTYVVRALAMLARCLATQGKRDDAHSYILQAESICDDALTHGLHDLVQADLHWAKAEAAVTAGNQEDGLKHLQAAGARYSLHREWRSLGTLSRRLKMLESKAEWNSDPVTSELEAIVATSSELSLIRAGRPFEVTLEFRPIDDGATDRASRPVANPLDESGEVIIWVRVAHGNVMPNSRRVWVDAKSGSDPVSFSVTLSEYGSTDFNFRVYSAWDGRLLHDLTTVVHVDAEASDGLARLP